MTRSNSSQSIEALWRYQRRKLQDPNNLNALIRQRNQIAVAHQGLVRKEAHRWMQICSEPFDDLVQEGNLGLVKAIDKFAPEAGAAFSSFAIPFIRGAIQHYLRDKGWGVVRPPRRAVERFAKVRKAQRDLQKLGRELPEAEVATGLFISDERWRHTVDARNIQMVSLDEDPIPVTDEEEMSQQEAEYTWLHQQISLLKEPHRSCLLEHYFAQCKLSQIAKRRGISEQLVKVWIEQGIRQLKESAAREVLG